MSPTIHPNATDKQSHRIAICESLARAAKFRARKLAELYGISLRHLERAFVEHFAQSPQKHLDQLRIEFAKSRLLSGASVKVVTDEAGFKQVSHFCRKFKEFTGAKPSEFQMSLPDNTCRPQITSRAGFANADGRKVGCDEQGASNPATATAHPQPRA